MRVSSITLGVVGWLALATSSFAQYAPYAPTMPGAPTAGPGMPTPPGTAYYPQGAGSVTYPPGTGSLSYPPAYGGAPGYGAPNVSAPPPANLAPSPYSPSPYSPSPYSPTPVSPPAINSYSLPAPSGSPTPAPSAAPQTYAPSSPLPYGPTTSPYLGSPGAMGVMPPNLSPPNLSAPWPGAPGAQPIPDPVSAPPDLNAGPYDPTGSGLGDGAWAGPVGPRWFASLGGLIMTRDKPNPTTLTVPIGTDMPAWMTTRDTTVDQYRGGFEARIGRTIGQQFAIEGVYWWIDPMRNTASITGPSNGLDAFFDFGTLSAGGTPMSSLFDGAHVQQIKRVDEFHNVEVNLLQQSTCCSGSRFGAMGLIGARYFRFAEGLSFTSASTGTNFGDNGGTTAGQYDVHVLNNFIGGQIGGRFHYYVHDKFRLYALPKIGVFANDIQHKAWLGRMDGVSAFDIHTQKTDVAILSQADLGFSWQITPRFCAYMAYRVLAVSRVALADNQYPPVAADLQAVSRTNTNADLILHGTVFGGQFVF